MGLLAWIVFGGLAGWLASVLMRRNDRMGCLTNIVVGVVGAFIGGFLFQLVTGAGISMGFNLRSFLVAVGGAVVLLFVVGLFGRRRR